MKKMFFNIGEETGRTITNFENLFGDVTDEVTIVADEKHGSGIHAERIF